MNNIYDVAILGGGPAGVAGGVYASRKRLESLFISKEIGGQAINSGSIENFIGHIKLTGLEFAKMLEDHLKAQDHIDIKIGPEVSEIKDKGEYFEISVNNGEKFNSKTILYALGSSYRKLNVPGEKELEGRGVFYCSICDAPLMKGKDVAVVGGGNSGAEAVFDLLPYANKIYILQRSDRLKMEEIYEERIRNNDKVEIILNANTTKIEGSPMVESIEYLDSKSGETKKLSVGGVFVSIGFVPNSGLLKDLVDLNERGNVVVDHKSYKTSHPRIWAAGDVADMKYRQINSSMGSGVIAMLDIYDYIKHSE